ncbi:rhodanese-like domain-containing protein [Hoeflea ulvae]|uniref:Rhodanese-like domain-containing protein n=1 Tax=Hoeflea ulvae TaxID=2983764 RepID=A0ABT3YD73_9HYPH|nr:rhodanese-like domain-containing protein [Hoeflea ulvae]MCY0093836.1 rhodanese-like domain-containing protein [Hoeflea ulvae]
MRSIPAIEARALLHGGQEIAFLDVREAGQFVEGHPLFAIPLPYSILESRIGLLVPRLTCPILLIDNGDGVAERVQARLSDMGYNNILRIKGGMPAWEASGFPVYKGVNVPSKTLGEMAELIWHPKMITADELARAREQADDLGFFDARPAAEYAKMRVPGAVCLPNGELAHRISAIGDKARIVVTCAGRTRGITGVIGLMLAGFDGKVAALENGTQGWALSGRDLERNNQPDPFPNLDTAGLAASRERADALIERFSLPVAECADVERMLSAPDRTTYVFDVRSPDEAGADPLAIAEHAASGQLVQATDQWVGVRNSRLVLCCDTGLRSALAAFWLTQLGYDVHILRITDALRQMAARPIVDAAPAGPIKPVSASDLLAMPDATVLDMRPSTDFRAAHVKGAIWTTRPGLAKELARNGAGTIAILADTEDRARRFARDAMDLGFADVVIVNGGHDALAKGGAELKVDSTSPEPAEAIDFPWFVHDRHDGNLESSRRYLAWETGLVDQLDAAEKAAFRLFKTT